MARSTQIASNKTGKIKFLFISLAVVLSVFLAYNLIFIGRIFPNIYLAGISVGRMDPEKAIFLVSEKAKVPEVIILKSNSGTFDLNTKDIDLTYDYVESIQRPYDFVRTGNIVYDFWHRIKLLNTSQEFGLSVKLSEEKLENFISVVAGQVSVDPVYPSATLEDSKLIINKGSAGTSLDSKLLRAQIGEALSLAKTSEIELPLEEVDPTLNEKEFEDFGKRAQAYLGKSIETKFEYSTFSFSDKEILAFLKPKGGFDQDEIKKQLFEIAKGINRDPQEPKFNFEDGKVLEFQPAKEGVELNNNEFIKTLEEKLTELESSGEKLISFEIPTVKTPPLVTTDEVNNLGIKELIGRGTSTYFHSIPGRVHNVSLATSRINGTLVKPGETFSFNETLGDVSKFTGYQTAYIIENGRTVLGDGGGVCQVSTTLFRAVLDAGLGVAERRAHAYRVSYYEQGSAPGIDATVYSPTTDFKFTNDTDNHILISAKADPKNYSLVFELYGTRDGRVSNITKPVVSAVTAPPPDLYQDDPTLATGKIKQVDFKAAGAKVSFNYSVTKDGVELHKKTFVSNYRAWQAIYLRGTGPAN